MTAARRVSTASGLDAVVAEGRRLADEAIVAFGALSAPQLNWQPAPGEWSVAQCFEHLLLSNRPFVPIVEAVRDGTVRPRLWERVPGLPRLFGSMLIATLQPDAGRKVNARPAFRPSESAIGPDVLPAFMALQERLLALMEATGHLDLARIIITSPVSRLVTYSVMDAYRIIVVHEQNHVAQARRVVASPGFPGPGSGSAA